jgi:hypothetical protein
MEVSGQYHDPAALPPGVTVGYEAGRRVAQRQSVRGG